MGESVRGWLLGTGLALSCFIGAWLGAGKVTTSELGRLQAENQQLRLFNAREVRRQKRPLAKVRWEAVEGAEHLMGVPGSLVAAVWQHENGPPDIETGVLGKTDAISRHLPVKDWPAYETARTLNVWAWEWLLTTPEGKQALKPMMQYVGRPYTAMGEAEGKRWAARVLKFQADIAKERGR